MHYRTQGKSISGLHRTFYGMLRGRTKGGEGKSLEEEQVWRKRGIRG